MIDVSHIINDPSFSTTYPIKRITFNLINGRIKVFSIDDIKIKCAIIPNINQIRRMSDYNFEYIDGKIGIFSKKALYGNAFDKIEDKTVIDFILFEKNYWQVEEIRTWQHHGFIIAYAKMYETQQIIEELNNELYTAEIGTI